MAAIVCSAVAMQTESNSCIEVCTNSKTSCWGSNPSMTTLYWTIRCLQKVCLHMICANPCNKAAYSLSSSQDLEFDPYNLSKFNKKAFQSSILAHCTVKQIHCLDDIWQSFATLFSLMSWDSFWAAIWGKDLPLQFGIQWWLCWFWYTLE